MLIHQKNNFGGYKMNLYLKDGNTLIKDIDLYYRDQTDRYRNFEGSNYTIYFTPNDG